MEKDNIINEDFLKEDIGYKKILMRHLDRLSELTTHIKEPGKIQTFHFAVMALENFLFPYHDQKYNEEKEKMSNEYHNADGKRLIRKVLTWNWSSGSDESRYIGLSLAMLELLQCLMARKGLLLETDTAGEVGGDQ